MHQAISNMMDLISRHERFTDFKWRYNGFFGFHFRRCWQSVRGRCRFWKFSRIWITVSSFILTPGNKFFCVNAKKFRSWDSLDPFGSNGYFFRLSKLSMDVIEAEQSCKKNYSQHWTKAKPSESSDTKPSGILRW